ncbi:hypothetical protein E2C01_079269 [Portunus trituberculatus]|uniref:Uncharacterized protein n=1 Tax=Portunus trituberculatus TaxID=210409 RepID=A0A5B7IJ51_PORTR|nr:hypothetical protein [Portunus trituberculatus]
MACINSRSCSSVAVHRGNTLDLQWVTGNSFSNKSSSCDLSLCSSRKQTSFCRHLSVSIRLSVFVIACLMSSSVSPNARPVLELSL